MTGHGTHSPDVRPAPVCPGCGRPSPNVGTGKSECDHTGKPRDWLGLPKGDQPAAPRIPLEPGPFGRIRYREPGERSSKTRNVGVPGLAELI